MVPPPRNGIFAFAAIAIVLACAGLTAVLWGMGSPLRVNVDGAERTVAQGATVADLVSAHYTQARSGSMFTVNGGIAKMRGGYAPTYERNGREVVDAQRVFDGDVITSGMDVTERTVSVKRSIDPTATIQGTGVILRTVSPGKPGVMLVRQGEFSGEIVSQKVLVPAENIVLVASNPASGARLVALTFDDGPWPGSTLAIVNILKAERVPGTFFEIGQQVKRSPQLSAAIVAAGNIVGNHSWSHPFLTKLKPAAVRKQITDTASAIKAATGVAPTLLRPPYGAINRNVWAQAAATHESVVLWNVDSLDWTRPGVNKIVATVQKEAGRASIVLMHDGGGPRAQTVAALPKVIAWFRARGYTFVNVAQMQALR